MFDIIHVFPKPPLVTNHINHAIINLSNLNPWPYFIFPIKVWRITNMQQRLIILDNTTSSTDVISAYYPATNHSVTISGTNQLDLFSSLALIITLHPSENDCCFTGDIFKCIFFRDFF